MHLGFMLLIAVSMVGCATVQTINPASPAGSTAAPANDSLRPGLIRYLSSASSAVTNYRRDVAKRKMRESCGGAYRIIAEGPQTRPGGVVSTDGNATAAHYQYPAFVPTPIAFPQTEVWTRLARDFQNSDGSPFFSAPPLISTERWASGLDGGTGGGPPSQTRAGKSGLGQPQYWHIQYACDPLGGAGDFR
jgi:hypothetical protein